MRFEIFLTNRIPLIMIFSLLLISGLQVKAEEADIKNIRNQISQFEKSLESKKDREGYASLKIALSKSIDVLKGCEKKASTELDELTKINSQSSGVENDQPTPEGVKDPKFKLLETELQKRLFECKFLLLKANQLREQTLKLLSRHQISDYLKSTPIYWNSSFEPQINVFSAKSQVIFLFVLLYLIVQSLLSYFLINRKNWFGESRYFVAAITTFGIASIALSYAKQEQIITTSQLWLLWGSLLIPSQASISNRFLPIIHAAIAVLISTLLIEPFIWQINKYIHLLIVLMAIGSLYLLERSRASFGLILAHGSILLFIAAIEISDYHALAHQLLIINFIFHIAWHLHHIGRSSLDSVFDYIYSNNHQWLVRFRKFAKVSKKKKIPGLAWIRWSLYFAFISTAFLSLISYSGISEAIVETVKNAFEDGFEIGTIKVNLRDILSALFVLGVLITFSWILKRKIELTEGRENSAQTAKAALFWYAAILTSFLTALSISGFSVQNLALIAGAFSVGIGFGLQNIVSNFISGIILLIERPVKPGDWVVINGTEGFIKNINIRATQIRTFDKSDILIPNTEFISNQVTNLTLGDNVGRLRFAVGVAYGSDTEKVRQILTNIVSQHPGVINDDDSLKPTIIFRQFGDSSLDFEIRCFLKDIKKIFSIRSDLHFEIDKQFRENGIEIPFPQRDLHIKSDKSEIVGQKKNNGGKKGG